MKDPTVEDPRVEMVISLITKIYSDRSASVSETREKLEKIEEEIEARLEALIDD